MNGVDTGWITDETRSPSDPQARSSASSPRLDVVDGAARVLDPFLARPQTRAEHGAREVLQGLQAVELVREMLDQDSSPTALRPRGQFSRRILETDAARHGGREHAHSDAQLPSRPRSARGTHARAPPRVGGVMVHVTGMLGFAHAYFVLRPRPIAGG